MRFRSPTAKYLVWVVLCTPALHIVYRYIADTMSYGEVLHETGNWSVGLLFVALAVTPLGRLAPKFGGWAFFRFHRRAIGVASFAYAALHTVAYLERKWGADLIVPEGLKPDIATGWLALGIFLVLATTSNDRSVRRLGKSWKTVHRTVYVSAALIFSHWILTAFEPQLAYTVLFALGVVETLRWVPTGRKQSKAR